jgi:hypothetical protein
MIAERTRLEAELAELGLVPMRAPGAPAKRLGRVPRGIDQEREFEAEMAEETAPATERELRKNDSDRAARLNRQNASEMGWGTHRDGILRLLGLTAAADDHTFAQAVARWQASQQGLTVDGILGHSTWALMSTAIDVDALPSAEKDAILSNIARILQQLMRKFKASDVKGLQDRRRRLKEEFESVPTPYVMRLYSRLKAPRKEDSLARAFHRRLATATRDEMIVVLGRRFFREYELRFNILRDRFSVENNPHMTRSDKDKRKKDINDLIGDVANSPGILWRRLLTRQDAALEGLVPASLPSLPASVRDAARRISDAQLDLFREWFPDGKGEVDFTPFQRVFEQFANGQLRDPSVRDHPGLTEPGSGVFFLFAEFAFLCVDSGLSPSIWTQALRTFVKMQEIFMHVYRENPKSPPPVDARLPSLGPEFRDVALEESNGRGFHFRNFRQLGSSVGVGRGQSDLRRKMALRTKYDRMSVDELKAAARDNLVRALRMP